VISPLNRIKEVITVQVKPGLPKVSIIIVNWNGLEDTSECLESLKKITFPNYEVILVDNNSTENDDRVLGDKFADYIHVIENDKNYGFAGGANIGMRYAMANSKPDYILLLNNDTIVDSNFLACLVEAAESQKSIGIVGGKICFLREPKQIQIVWGKTNLWNWQIFSHTPPYSSLHRTIDKGQYDYTREADWVSGCCILIKKDVINKIGLLEESYFGGWDDTDYCLCAKKAGFAILYTHRAQIWHKNAQSFNKVNSYRAYLDTRNRFIFMKRHAGKPQYILFVISIFTVYFWVMAAYYSLVVRKPAMVSALFKGMVEGFSLNVEPVR
jgi:hypothetical protein